MTRPALERVPKRLREQLPELVEEYGIDAASSFLGMDLEQIRKAAETVLILREGTWITTSEAAHMTGACLDHVQRSAAAGLIKARKYGRRWLLDRESVEVWGGGPGRERWWRGRWYPVGPLLERIQARGGLRACGIDSRSADYAALRAASRRPAGLTEPIADRLVVTYLGLTLGEVWPDEYALL